MKTRVIRIFDTRNAVDVYWVQKWALWDAPDLRAAFPDDYGWRYVRPYRDPQDARDIALRLAERGHNSGEQEVIAEFGNP
jgi:hypothetical protein